MKNSPAFAGALAQAAGRAARRLDQRRWLLFAEWGEARVLVQGAAGRLVTARRHAGCSLEGEGGALVVNPSEFSELEPPELPAEWLETPATLPVDSRLVLTRRRVAILRDDLAPVLETRRWWELHLRGGAVMLGADADALAAALTGGATAPPEIAFDEIRAEWLIFSPAAAGLLLHELAGHPLEADHPLAGEFRVGSALLPLPLDLVDDPRAPGSGVEMAVDDEGEPAAPRLLLERGRVAGWLAHRASARPGRPAGNARRESYLAPALPRASVLHASGGESELDSLLRGPGRRVRVDRCSGHLAGDRVTLRCEAAVELRHGFAQARIAPFTLRWKRADLARALTRASVETGGPFGALCGKSGQAIPIAVNAPWLEVRL